MNSIHLKYVISYFQANIEKLNLLRNFIHEKKGNISLFTKKNKKIISKNEKVKKYNDLIYGKSIIMTICFKTTQEIKEFHSLLSEICIKLQFFIHSIVINENVFLNSNHLNLLLNVCKNEKNIIHPYSFVYFLNILKLKQINYFKNLNKKRIPEIGSLKIIKYII
jgi:enoyl-[acyl-carrier-protein] reductase (NADH)